MSQTPNNAPLSGGIPWTIGQASAVRIPIPGTSGLSIEFAPRGRVPASGSTSTLFFQDVTGKRHLRLDFGYNVRSKTIDFHWNQKGTHATFGLADHAATGRFGKLAYASAKYFRHAGRVLMVAGATMDAVSIVHSSRPLRRASEVVSGWALAWAGCKLVGAGGAAVGTSLSPLGTAAGGVVGCIIGGAGGYYTGAKIGSAVFDWAEGTVFTPLFETTPP